MCDMEQVFALPRKPVCSQVPLQYYASSQLGQTPASHAARLALASPCRSQRAM
jgi:hypothetical protein